MCQHEAAVVRFDARDSWIIACPNCGEFVITVDLADLFSAARRELNTAMLDCVPILSEAARWAWLSGGHYTLTTENFQEIADDYRASASATNSE